MRSGAISGRGQGETHSGIGSPAKTRYTAHSPVNVRNAPDWNSR